MSGRTTSRHGHSQKARDAIMYFLGVTGFDGLHLEVRAAQCTPVQHLNLTGNKLAKNTLASAAKSPYFGKVGDIAFAYATARG